MKTIMLALVAGSMCAAAAAQQGEIAGNGGATGAAGGAAVASEPKQDRFFDFEMGLNVDYAFRSDVDGGGDVSVTRSMFSFDFSRSFSPDFRAGILMTTEFSWYDFDDAPGLIAGTGKPFSQLIETDFTPHVACKINDQWTAVSGLFFRFAGETHADVSDSFTWGGYVAGRYSASKDFSITIGVRANSRIEDDWTILPALGMDWHVSPSVRVQLIPAVGGEAFRVSTPIGDDWTFMIDAEYQSRDFRLEDGAPLSEGVVRDARLSVGMGVLWKPCDTVEITAHAGAIAWQEFRIDDSDGNRLTESNTDPTPYIFIGGTITF